MQRTEWINYLERLARPVLEAAADGRLRETMTLERAEGSQVIHGGITYERECFSPFEAVARLLCGIAPWLELPGGRMEPAERELHERFRSLAVRAVEHQITPESPDYAGFSSLSFDRSPLLVNTAFLAQALLRAPKALGAGLSELRGKLMDAFMLSRAALPGRNNWILFPAMVEAGVRLLGGEADRLRAEYGFRQFEQWYLGGGVYGDGAAFAADYYNSYVIGPMLLELTDAFPDVAADLHDQMLARAKRCAEILERMICPDGSFIAQGRSIAYRCGAFHLLALLALREQLPESLAPGQVRAALGAVIKSTLSGASYRADGFLHIGICASQPEHGEHYITTGSLYLCSTAFLPLGLPPEADFWRNAERAWSQKSIWRDITA